MKVSNGTIARTIILALALVNQALQMSGHSVIPIDETAISDFISYAFLGVSTIVAWWKNNSFTQKALAADATFKKVETK